MFLSTEKRPGAAEYVFSSLTQKQKRGKVRKDLVLLKTATIEFPLATSLLSIDKLTTSNDLIYQI